MFHVIEEKHVILVSRGVYRQAKVYRRDGTEALYAGHSGGYIRLTALFGGRGGTSSPNVSWEPGEDVKGGTAGKPVLVQ